ncbi:hypothetical protein [Streptomyces sp. NPDC001970]
MNEPARLEAVDQADFEQALRQALDTPDIHAALHRPAAPVTAEQMHARALAASDAIAAEASAEYTALLDLRAAAQTSAPTTRPDGGRGLLAALAVLTPLVSATAAAVFLLLGHVFWLAGTQQPLADTLIHVGWTAAGVAALAILVAAAALLITAARHRTPSRSPRTEIPALTQAHEAWRRALLKRGLIPFLRRELHLPAPQVPPPALPAQRGARFGDSGPDFSGPDFTGPASPSQD